MYLLYESHSQARVINMVILHQSVRLPYIFAFATIWLGFLDYDPNKICSLDRGKGIVAYERVYYSYISNGLD